MLQTMLECMKTTQEMKDKIQFNLWIFEIQDPGFKKGEFNDEDMWKYLFEIPELGGKEEESEDKKVTELAREDNLGRLFWIVE